MTGRDDRNRDRTTGEAAGRWSDGEPIVSHRRLVVVYDGGSIPTSGDKVFLSYPAAIDFNETEGASWTTSADSGETIPFVVLGTTAPDSGDALVVHGVGGRWATRLGLGVVPCSSCDIPKKDLTLSWAGNGPTSPWNVPFSTTLVYNGAFVWLSACIDRAFIYSLSCRGGVTILEIATYGAGSDCGGASVTSNPVVLDRTCSPYHLHWIDGGGDSYVDE